MAEPRKSRGAPPRGEWMQRCLAGALLQFDAPPPRVVGRLAYAVKGRVGQAAVAAAETHSGAPANAIRMVGVAIQAWVDEFAHLRDAASDPVQVVVTPRPKAPRTRDPVRLVLIPQSEREIYSVRAYWRLWVSGPWWALATPEARAREVRSALAWAVWDCDKAHVRRPKAPIPSGRLVPVHDLSVDGQGVLFNREETP